MLPSICRWLASALLLSLLQPLQAEQVVFNGMLEEPVAASPELTLFDLLTIEPSASIFFSYARESDISRLLVDHGSRSTFLVPTNRAVMALARKPCVFVRKTSITMNESFDCRSHQSAYNVQDDEGLSEQELDERSKSNVQHWISLHVIPVRAP
jgi:hypothetical protein